MGHGASNSGKYFNGCTDADVNRGCYGKLSSDQIEERIDLHARRQIEGHPTVVDIATHWMTKYKIEMSYQSEKKWCNSDKNKLLIDARQEELQRSGEMARPAFSTQTLLNSLAQAATDSAENCKNLKRRMHAAMNTDCTPWGVLEISEEKYLNALGPKRKNYDAKVKLILQTKKDSLKLVAEYSKAHISMSKELRESVKQTYEMGKYLGLLDAKAKRKQLNDASKVTIEDVTDEEKNRGNQLTECEIEDARKQLGYDEDN